MRGRRGFTLIEVLVAMMILGILINIAIPAVQDAKRKALAASAIADVQVIQTAVIDYFAENDVVPASAGWGAIPAGLRASLPNNFVFMEGDVSYRWQRFGARRQRRTGQLGRIRVRSSDRKLATDIRRLYQGRATGRGGTLTLIVE